MQTKATGRGIITQESVVSRLFWHLFKVKYFKQKMGPDNRKNLAVFKEIKKKLGKTKLYLMNALCSQNKGAGLLFFTLNY